MLIVMSLAIASCVFVLWLVGRYNESRLELDWRTIVTPEGQRAYEELRGRFGLERPVIDLALARPERVALEGHTREAVELLLVGHEYMTGLAADRRQILEGMARYSRMVAGMMPLPPLRPEAFRLRELATLAGLGLFAHHLFATVPERFRLRVGILRRGTAVILRALVRASNRPAGTASQWALVASARADWRMIDLETLESFRALVSSVLAPSPTAAEKGA